MYYFLVFVLIFLYYFTSFTATFRSFSTIFVLLFFFLFHLPMKLSHTTIKWKQRVFVRSDRRERKKKNNKRTLRPISFLIVRPSVVCPQFHRKTNGKIQSQGGEARDEKKENKNIGNKHRQKKKKLDEWPTTDGHR